VRRRFFRRYFFALAQRNSLQSFRRSRKFLGFQKCNKARNTKAGTLSSRGPGRVPQFPWIWLEFLNYFLCDKKVLGSGALLDSPS
jgi:hypothetical protein